MKFDKEALDIHFEICREEKALRQQQRNANRTFRTATNKARYDTVKEFAVGTKESVETVRAQYKEAEKLHSVELEEAQLKYDKNMEVLKIKRDKRFREIEEMNR